MNPRPSSKGIPLSAEAKARLLERLKPNSNVIFVDKWGKNA